MSYLLSRVVHFEVEFTEWIKTYESKFLENKTPLQCIHQNRFDLLYPFLMAATATDGERQDLKAALLRGKYFPDDPTPSRKRALTAQILDEIAQERGEFH